MEGKIEIGCRRHPLHPSGWFRSLVDGGAGRKSRVIKDLTAGSSADWPTGWPTGWAGEGRALRRFFGG